jgi:hypothetical protein
LDKILLRKAVSDYIFSFFTWYLFEF